MLELLTSKELAQKFAKTIEATRIQKNITQKELAKRAGISSATYSNFLKSQKLNFINLIEILKVLKINDVLELFAKQKEFTTIEEIRNSKNQTTRKRVRK